MADAFGNKYTIFFSATAMTVAGAEITAVEARAATLTMDTGQTQKASVTRDRSTSEYKKRSGTTQAVGSLAKGLTVDVVVDHADPMYIALLAALNSGAAFAFAECVKNDGTKLADLAAYQAAGSRGIAGNWYVTSMGEEHPEDGVTVTTVTLTPVAGQVIDLI